MADYPVRTPANNASPYDHPQSPLVVRRGAITAERLLSGRQSYVKAVFIHTRGFPNRYACGRCAAAYAATGEFSTFAGKSYIYLFF